MGDPLQIEPVLTVPLSLVEAVGRVRLGETYSEWSPAFVSVQNLADRCNPFGVYMEEQWVGSPLRVHRRCQNPMFRIANDIAYGKSMVHVDVPDSFNWEASCWFHLPGICTDRQYVAIQGEFMIRKIADYYKKHGHLPKIYIISPFRKVRSRLRSLVINHRFEPKIIKKELAHWATKRIGTVHTFQGKEEEVVYFILGADEKMVGSIVWVPKT